MRFAAIADDLTGAVELASLLVREGVPARVLTSRATAEDAAGLPALVFGLKVRTVAKARALAEVEQALKLLRPLKPKQLFYKYCATFELHAAREYRSDRRPSVAGDRERFHRLLPCLSGGGSNRLSRASLRGRHAGVAVAKTLRPADADARAGPRPRASGADGHAGRPCPQRRLRGWSGQCCRARGGAEAGRDRLRDLRRDDEDDLRTLAAATVDWPLMTGGSSVAVYYPQLWRERGEIGAREEPALPDVAGSRRGARRKLRGAHGRAAPGLWPPPPGAAARRGRAHDRRAGRRSRAVLGPRASARWPDRLRDDEPARPRRRRAGALRAKESRGAGRNRRSAASPRACARTASAASSSPAAKPRARSSIISACGPAGRRLRGAGALADRLDRGRRAGFHLKSGKLGPVEMFMQALGRPERRLSFSRDLSPGIGYIIVSKCWRREP